MLHHDLQLKIKSLPDKPGVYIFKESNNEIIYIGKAKSLKKRVASYFQNEQTYDEKIEKIRSIAKDLDFVVTNTESEALILENNLIKEHKPKMNIKLRDDKTYPFLRITTSEKIPRVEIVRKRGNKEDVYFGPFANSKALKIALRQALSIFPIARCNKQIELNNTGKSCLFFQMKKCLGPCFEDSNLSEYRKTVEHFIKIFKGKHNEIIIELEKEMAKASENLDFEKAAIFRDRTNALSKIVQRQVIISKDINAEYDILGLAITNSLAVIQLLFMREGRIINQDYFVLNIPTKQENKEIISSFIKLYYSQREYIPRRILTIEDIFDQELINEWLNKKQKINQGNIIIKTQTIEENELVKLATENAETNLKTLITMEQMQSQIADNSLNELKEILNLPKAPKRIEGFDISTLQGSNSVASCVVFEEGRPKKKDYRKFIIKSISKQDDYSSLQEVIKRRYSSKTLYKNKIPDLILIDGGAGQVSSVLIEMRKLELNIPLIGLAKENEEIHLPTGGSPIKLNQRSEALKLLQKIRDEAHRFALNFHKLKRSKRMLEFSLTKIPNLGENKIANLLSHFGTIENIANASIEDLIKVKGINKKLAETIFKYYSDLKLLEK